MRNARLLYEGDEIITQLEDFLQWGTRYFGEEGTIFLYNVEYHIIVKHDKNMRLFNKLLSKLIMKYSKLNRLNLYTTLQI